jgi:ribosome-associated protein
MIQITPSIALDERELHEDFIRAAGPGGQNVNKVSTAVQLRFDVAQSASLPEDVRERLLRQAQGRITAEGVLIITARQFRTQADNRRAARALLVELVRRAAYPPKPHLKTRPTLASKQRRLEAKRHRGESKRLRRDVPGGEE